MNMTDRALIRSVAANQVKLEAKKGKEYSPESIIDIWNTDYDLVEEKDLPALKQQYALEVAAERLSSGKSIPMKAVGVAEIKIDGLLGKLKLGPKDPVSNPGGAGGAIEA